MITPDTDKIHSTQEMVQAWKNISFPIVKDDIPLSFDIDDQVFVRKVVNMEMKIFKLKDKNSYSMSLNGITEGKLLAIINALEHSLVNYDTPVAQDLLNLFKEAKNNIIILED